MRQLHAQNGGLDRVETAVPADLVVVIALLAAVVGERPYVVGDGVIIRRDQPAIAIRATQNRRMSYPVLSSDVG